MGYDTTWWGPSAWQLFHLVAFFSPNPQQVLLQMKEMLPCKFCRASTAEFVAKHPLKGDPGKWLYDIHNMVNNKLRTQCASNPEVADPGPDPSFEEVKAKYAAMKPTQVPGRDFLFAMASNYPDDPQPEDMARHREFIANLGDVYPFEKLRTTFKSYLEKHSPIPLEHKKEYLKWMYGLLKYLSRSAHAEILSYRGLSARANFFASGCDRKTYRGKTCRRTSKGFLTKNRDPNRTRRIVLTALLK
jgi:hypothetical protein